MKYNISFDQEFAIVNEMTLTQVTALAACMSIATWADSVAINGKIWYRYAESKMAEDFPLLFGCAKRCYKNFAELAEMGFIELTKIGKDKYLTYTAKCAEWNGPKVQKRTISPETDEKESENGLNNSPKSDSNNNIYINNNITDNSDGGAVLFPEPETKVEKQRGTTESLCLFANSRYNRFEDFAACFVDAEFKEIDIAWYYRSVADWSAQHAKKKNDWIATARNFMRSDIEKNKLHKLPEAQVNPDDAWMRVMQRRMDLSK